MDGERTGAPSTDLVQVGAGSASRLRVVVLDDGRPGSELETVETTSGAERQKWRTGRKVGRTVYAMAGDAPSDDDTLIGMMDTPELAAAAVFAHNKLLS